MARAPSRGGTVSRARGASAPVRLVPPPAPTKQAVTPAGQSARSFAPSAFLPHLTTEEQSAIHAPLTFGQTAPAPATTSDAAASLAAAIAQGVAAASLGGGGSSGGGSSGGSDSGGSDPSIDSSGDTQATPDDTDETGTDDPNADPTLTGTDDPNADPSLLDDPSTDPTLGGVAVADANGLAIAGSLGGTAIAPTAPPMARWVKVLGVLLLLGIGGWAAYAYLWPRAKRTNPKRRKKKRGHTHPYAKGGRAGPEVWR